MPEVADFVLDRLKQWGIHRICGYPGDGINGFVFKEAFSSKED